MRRGLLLILLALPMLAFWARPAASAGVNCDDFGSQAEAQAFLRQDPSDPEGLDGNRGHNPEDNGIACESNPAPYDLNSVYEATATTVTTQPFTATNARPATTPTGARAVTVARRTVTRTATTGSNTGTLALWGAMAISLGTLLVLSGRPMLARLSPSGIAQVDPERWRRFVEWDQAGQPGPFI